MEQERCHRILKKVSVTIEAGYKCDVCGWQTVTFDGQAPDSCGNCGFASPKIVWKNKIKNVTEVEVLPNE